MKKFILAACYLVLSPLITMAQVLPPDQTETPTEVSLFDENSSPVIETPTLSPTAFTDTESTEPNKLTVEVTDDNQVVAVKLVLGLTAEELTTEISLEIGSGDKWEGEIPDLEAITYYYKIIATDDDNESTVSDLLSFEVIEGIPVVPQNISAAELYHNKVVATWDLSEKATNYTYELNTTEDFSGGIVASGSVTEPILTIDNLEIETTYYLKVNAVRESTETMTSEYGSLTFTTLEQPAPELASETAELLPFASTLPGEVSELQTYTLTGEYLTNSLTITPPENFEIALEDTWYTNSAPLVLTEYNNESPFELTIKVRFSPTIPGVFSGNIVHTTENLPADLTIAVTGTGIAYEPTNQPTGFRLGGQAENNFTFLWDTPTGDIFPTGYTLFISLSNPPLPVDGVAIEQDTDFSDGIASFQVAEGSTSIEVMIPGSETKWLATLIPKNGTDGQVNYKTDEPLAQAFLFTPLNDRPNAWINEFHYDNATTVVDGTEYGDTEEDVEIVIENISQYPAENFMIIHYNGADGEILTQKELGEPTLTLDGFSFFHIPFSDLQNGDDGLALIYQNKVVQFISYEDTFMATEGPALGYTSTLIPVEESNDTPIFYSLQLSGTGSQYSDFTWQEAQQSTYGALNPEQSLSPSPVSQTVWSGNISTGWEDAGNWSDGVPSSSLKAIIPAGCVNYPTLNSTISCKALILESDASLCGQEFLPTDALIYVKRSLSIDKWLFLTSPVTNATTSTFHPNYGLVYLITYDNDKPEDATAWNYVQDQAMPLNPMTGYGFFSTRQEMELIFSGNPITTNQQHELRYLAEGNNWNFIGNPYLGSIAWSSSTLTNTTNSAYIFDPEQNTYLTIDSDGKINGETQGYIPPLQGFFIESIAPETVELDITTTTHGVQNFYKSIDIPEEFVQLKATGINGCDYATVKFSESNQDECNICEDSRKRMNYDIGLPQVWIEHNNVKLAVDQRNSYPEVLPLGIYISEKSEITLSAKISENFTEERSLFLRDNQTGEIYDIRNSNAITVEVTPDQVSGRFELILKNGTGWGTQQRDGLKIFGYQNTITIDSNHPIDGTIAIYSLLGQKIMEEKLSQATHHTLEPGTGNFIVRWKDKQGIQVHKITLH